MIIKRVQIYGFGQWVDQTIDFSNRSFICLYGKNESGKSTLYQFILFILFGLPPRKREFFRTKKGGRLGGRLVVKDEQVGTYTIERLDDVNNGAARVFLEGKEFGEDWLLERLNYLTKDIYHAIYSFSSHDLQEILHLDDEDIGELLLEISLTGTNHIYAMEKQLEQQMGKLFKPYGKIPEINQQLKEVEKLQEKVKKLQLQEEEYRQLTLKISSTKDQMNQIQRQIKKKQERLFFIRKKGQALPLIQQYQHHKRLLKKQPREIVFPTNGVDRLKEIKDQWLPLQSKKKLLKDQLQDIRKHLQALENKLYKEEEIQQAEAIFKKKAKYIELAKEEQKLHKQMVKEEQSLSQQLQDLNLSMETKELKKIHFPFHIEHLWLELHEQAKNISQEHTQLKEEKQSIDKQYQFLLKEEKRLKKRLLKEGKLKRYKKKMMDYHAHQYMKQQNNFIKQDEGFLSQLGKRYNTYLIGSGLLSFIFIGVAFYFEQYYFYLIALLTVAFGLFQWLQGKQMIHHFQSLRADHKSKEKNLLSVEEATTIERLLNEHEQANHRLSALQEQKKNLEIEELKWEEKSKAISRQENHFNQRKAEQIEQYPFLKQIHIQYWPQLYQQLSLFMNRIEAYDALKEQMNKMKEEQEKILHALKKVLTMLKILEEEQDEKKMFSTLDQWISEQHSYQMEYEQYVRKEQELEHHLAKVLPQIEYYQKELNELLAIAGVTDEDAFYRVSKQYEEKRKLKQKKEELYEQLSLMFSSDQLEKILKEKPLQIELEQKEQQYQKTLEALDEKKQAKIQEHAKAKADLEKLETSEDYSEVMHQYELAKQHLHHLSLEWSTLKFAGEMLKQTKKEYQDRYLNKVLHKTSIYFGQLTNGKYRKVYAPQEKRPFQVEAADGTLFSVNELSTGTVHQLYISLRIAVSERMGEKFPVPFIMDDAFLNFDAIRLEQVLKIFHDLSKYQQVILLTCRKEILNHSDYFHVIHLKDKQNMHV